jgi:plastocyanin
MSGVRIALLAFVAAAAFDQANASAAPSTRLVGRVGPGQTITLRTAFGRTVKTLRSGRYTIVIRDRSSVDNFHLIDRDPTLPDKKTGVRFVGVRTWTVILGKGSYRYVSDPHRSSLRGTFRVN